MKKNLFLSWALACTTVVCAQQSDPVLMTINNKNVTRSEFEYIYNKNRSVSGSEQLSLADYAKLFINFKLKVAEAESLGLDTTRAFHNEFMGYRQQVAAGYLSDATADEAYAHQQYDSLQSTGEWQQVRVAHIFKILPQNSTQETKTRLQHTVDSIYTALQGGASFVELAKLNSDDRPSASQGGALPWIGRRQAIPEFEKVAFELQPNTYSKPFESANGFHLIFKYEEQQLPYDKVRDQILSLRARKGMMSKGQEAKIAELRKEYELSSDMTDPQVLAYEDQRLEKKYPEFAHLMQEYRDGILLFEISKTQVWDKAAEDVEGLAKFFSSHKANYKWDELHYKGAVIHARDEVTLAKAKALLKETPQTEWSEKIAHTFNTKDSVAVRAQIGLFVKGTNKFVDAEIFNAAKPESIKNFPCSAVCGQRLKAPEAYTDVRGKVTGDYQNYLENQWINQLKKKYKVEIKEDVLKTINQH